MQFSIDRQKLTASIQEVMVAVSSRAAIPILTGIKIEATTKGLVLTGSDSNISIESFIPAEENGTVFVEDIVPGSIVLQARYFPQIIRKLPESTVHIQADEELNVTIKSGKAIYNLNGQDAEEYPQLPKLQVDEQFDIPIDLLKSIIKQTVFAISSMETRPILTGVNLQVHGGELTVTATDSHRLASRTAKLEGVDVDIPSIVIPGKSLDELQKILDDTEETVKISMTNNLILFKTENLNFLSRLLDGKYPETSRLIPNESKTCLHIKTRDLLQMIDRASLLAREERNNVVKLSTQGNERIEITSNSPEVGQVSEDMVLESFEGEELNISFSAKYMIDALRAVESDEVSIDFTGAMRPFIIRPTNGDPILQLIVPVRTY